MMIRSRLVLQSIVFVGTVLFTAGSAHAQVDTVAPPIVAVAQPDTLQPPISPGRAFFYSLLLPGAAQNKLGRHRAAVGLVTVEVLSIAMMRESASDVAEARRQVGDSLVMSYVDASGNLLAKPTLQRRRFENSDVSARRSHVEDWIALLAANHLFAAADAFVAANLWDVSARVSGDRNNFLVMAQIRW